MSNKTNKGAVRLNGLSYAVSLALAILASEAAMAQEKPQPKVDEKSVETPAEKTAAAKDAKPVSKEAAANELEKIVVIGTRASQQSSIARKKGAATAQDSIVAEDVGAFPDRNIAEAISRISGIALDRGDFGEGVTVSVRGNDAAVTRVELDGQAVQAGGGTNLLQGGDGRGVELRELSSDLIKSVDVVKGSTAAMTEGSLGGGIIINTRTGLDFAKPYYSLRTAISQGSLNKKKSPNLNLVLADKFFDKRLGVLVNLSKSEYHNEIHQITNGGVNNQQGLVRLLDFDNSPQKTFVFNPAVLDPNDPAVDLPIFAAPLTAGGFFNSTTPRELVTRSAAAQDKAACYTAFPALTAAQTGAIIGATARNNAINQRSNELLTCLNQWNDYTPALIRSYVRGQDDRRQSGDIRLDFKVNNELSLYSKLSRSQRDVYDVVGNFSVGGAVVANPAGSFVDAANGVRSVNPAAPAGLYHLFPTTASWRAANLYPALGAVANVKPGYTVDDSHHVTSYTTTDASYGTDMITSRIETSSKYLQLGGEYRSGRLRARFLAGDARSDFLRNDRRASLGYQYGEATFSVQPDGSWGVTTPNGGSGQLDYERYAPLFAQAATAAVPLSPTNTVAVPAYTAAQKPLVTPVIGLNEIRMLKSETEEQTAKLDVDYNLREQLPVLTWLKGGLNLRKTAVKNWGFGSSNPTVLQEPSGTFGSAAYVPGVYLPSPVVRNTIVGCENTPGSLGAGGQACAYGFNPSTNPQQPQIGQMVLNQAQYLDLVKQVLSVAPNGQFYGGAPNRAPGLINGWTQIDIAKLYELGGWKSNMGCLVECTATDGKVYQQPFSLFGEKSMAGYLMADFDLDRNPFTGKDWPFGLSLEGNFGWRVVKTDVTGTGFMTFTSIRKTPAFDPFNPNAAAGIVSTTARQMTSIKESSTDVMPSLNLALWLMPDKLVTRYNRAKTVARPPGHRLIPNISCTYDERRLDAVDDPDGSEPDQFCSGVMGNPGLKPFTNVNQNLAFEWYVNRDTMFTLAAFKQKGKIGAPNLRVGRSGVKVFQGTDAIDPVTGTPLSDMEFNFSQWENEQPSTRRGLEFGTKLAFSFLPSVLRHTGLDANYTRVRSAQLVPTYEQLSGDVLPKFNEPKYSYNASLWYDDGAFSARLSLQVVDKRFLCYSPCGNGGSLAVNNLPSPNMWNVRVGYNPGAPIFASRTSFVDGKMSYRFKNGLEIFVEGRNLTKERTQTNTGGYQEYADGTPSVYQDGYFGRRVMLGLNLRSL